MLTATRRLERRREGRKSSRRQGEARAVGTAAHICLLRPGARGRHLLFRRLRSGVGRCSAGAGAAVLHGAATFLTVTALRELDSSRPRSETARENADSPGEGPRAPRGFCEASPTLPSGRHRPRRPPAPGTTDRLSALSTEG